MPVVLSVPLGFTVVVVAEIYISVHKFLNPRSVLIKGQCLSQEQFTSRMLYHFHYVTLEACIHKLLPNTDTVCHPVSVLEPSESYC